MNEEWEYIDFLNGGYCSCCATCELTFKINHNSRCLDLDFNYFLRKLNILVLVPFK